MNRCQTTSRHDQAAIRGTREGRDSALDLASVTHIDWDHLRPDRWREGLDDTQLAAPSGQCSVPNDCRSSHARRDLFEQLQPFSADAVFVYTETGDITAGPRQTIDEAAADRINDGHEHDRHRAGRLLQRCDARTAARQDYIGRRRDQLRREFANTISIGRAPTVVDLHIAADGPAQLLQPLMESREARLSF